MGPALVSILFALGLALIIIWYLRRGRVQAAAAATRQIHEILDVESLGDIPDAPPELPTIEPGRKEKSIDALAAILSKTRTLRSADGRSFMAELDHRLILAGLRDRYTPEQALALALSIWALGVALPLLLGFIFPFPKLLLIIIVVFFLLYPILRLRQDIKNRQEEIEVEVPFFINELYMSLSSGATIDQAIVRAARTGKEDGLQNILAREFAQAQVEYSMGGKTQEQALRDVTYRTGVYSVANLVEALVQGLRTGADLSKTLNDYADQAQELWAQAMRDFKNRKDPAITIGVVITMFGGFMIYAAPLLVGMFEALSGL
jgi:tight adherence protein C